jgi:A/G-specific adenine glycosylase
MTEKQGQFSRDLLAWYDASKRDLPWRRLGHDPYAVWVSEIMLQQTTVAAVIPFYHKWMSRFSTVSALADAPLDDVLRYWAGLGYYARARNLHKGAQRVMAEFGGLVPSDPKTLLSLPGIGRYTAGAILSIAFNLDAPILDANVIRVMARVHAVTGDPKTSSVTQAQLWRLAEEAIPSGRAGDFNQALMELGALVCEAGAPKCGTCPVAAECRAKALGEPTAYPQFSNVKKWLDVEDVSVALRCPTRPKETLIVQRSPDLPLWGGLWELPRGTRQDGEALEVCAARAVCESVGVRVRGLRPFGVVKHVVANRRVTLHGFEASFEGEVSESVRHAWISAESRADYALATPQVKLTELLWRQDAQGRLEL